MPGTLGPNLGITWGYSLHEAGWGVGGYNPGFAKLDTLIFLTVINTLNTPPGSPSNGDRYLVGSAPTGAFVGHTDSVAVYLTIGTPGWSFYAPKLGWKLFHTSIGSTLRWDGSDWIEDQASPLGFDLSGLAHRDVIIYDSVSGTFKNQRPKYAIGAQSDPDSILNTDQILLLHPFATDVSFPDDFGDYQGLQSYAYGFVPGATDIVIRIRKATLSAPTVFADVGSITIASGTVGPAVMVTTGGQLDFASGDILMLMAPNAVDISFKGFFCVLVGFES